MPMLKKIINIVTSQPARLAICLLASDISFQKSWRKLEAH